MAYYCTNTSVPWHTYYLNICNVKYSKTHKRPNIICILLLFNDLQKHGHLEREDGRQTRKLNSTNLTLERGDSKTANEILEYLKKWLVKHFQEADKKSTEYFNKSKLK